MNKLKKCGGEE